MEGKKHDSEVILREETGQWGDMEGIEQDSGVIWRVRNRTMR